MAYVVIVGTCDTKLQELLFLRDQIKETAGVETFLIDAGRKPTVHKAITIPKPTSCPNMPMEPMYRTCPGASL